MQPRDKVQRFQEQGERTRRGLYRDGALLRYKALKRRALPVKSQRPKQGSDVFSQSVIAGTTRRRSVSAGRTIQVGSAQNREKKTPRVYAL